MPDRERKKRYRDNRGFTLLEAMTAMALVATTGMALFAWINTSLEGMTRIAAHEKQQHALATAMEYIQCINPMDQPEGTTVLGSWTIAWQATLVEPVKRGAGYPGGTSPFRLGLYVMQVSIFKDQTVTNTDPVAQFALRQVGFQKIPSDEQGF
jgi:general secretion pathway protein I